MNLLEIEIENIIYSAPWLLDTNFILPNITGSKGKGRQVNIGNSRVNRHIDLLFKDIRDNRPVIVELKKGEVKRKDIAQILEYRSLLITIEDEGRELWTQEYGINFMCPKLVLVAQGCSEENLVSANLAGVEIRLFGGDVVQKSLIQDIGKIECKINSWQQFLASGQASLSQRDEWIRQKYTEISNIVHELEIQSLKLKPLYKTTGKYFWNEGMVYPFINFCISYKGEYAIGIYEYNPLDDGYGYSDKYIYMDILIPTLYNNKDNDGVVKRIKTIIFEEMKQVAQYKGGIITIQLERNLLNNVDGLKAMLKTKIREGIDIIDSLEK